MSIFRALGFTFKRQNLVPFVYIAILNLIWLGSIEFFSGIIRPREAYMIFIPLRYGSWIFYIGYASLSLRSMMNGEPFLVKPNLFKGFKEGLLVGLAMIVYGWPAYLTFTIWMNLLRSDPSFQPNSPLTPAGGTVAFLCLLGIAAFLLLFIGAACFFFGLARYASSDNWKHLFSLRYNYVAISWRLGSSMGLFMRVVSIELFYFLLTIVIGIGFGLALDHILPAIDYQINYISPIFVIYNLLAKMIGFCAYPAYARLLADYAEVVGFQVKKVVVEPVEEE